MKRKGMPLQGKFVCRNPSKYKGDTSRIFYRSSLELTLDNYFDLHPDVIEWSSEEIAIPYRDKSRSGSIHHYFPDFTYKKKLKDGTIKSIMVEVKPSSQVQVPKPKRNKRRYLSEVMEYTKNQSKWESAREYCKKHGMSFIILTEKEING